MFSIRRKNFERVSQFLQRAAENFKVAARGTVALQFIGSLLDLFNQFRMRFQFNHMFDDIRFGLINMPEWCAFGWLHVAGSNAIG